MRLSWTTSTYQEIIFSHNSPSKNRFNALMINICPKVK